MRAIENVVAERPAKSTVKGAGLFVSSPNHRIPATLPPYIAGLYVLRSVNNRPVPCKVFMAAVGERSEFLNGALQFNSDGTFWVSTTMKLMTSQRTLMLDAAETGRYVRAGAYLSLVGHDGNRTQARIEGNEICVMASELPVVLVYRKQLTIPETDERSLR